MSRDITAIDILIEPDSTALARAKAENARLRAHYPDGFALDARHQPHITVLQRYVRTGQLPAVLSAVESEIRAFDLSGLRLSASGISHMPVAALPGIGIAAMLLRSSPELLELQAALIEAVKPFVESGGTAAAFARPPEDPHINDDTLRYVERYVPDHSGPNYEPHVTLGLAQRDFLIALEAEPFEACNFHPAGIAVYQLGNNGTAQQLLMSWEI